MILLIFVISSFLISFKIFAQEGNNANLHPNYSSTKDSVKVFFSEYSPDSLVRFAKQFLGVPYLSAGKSPKGFDCSGFTFYCHKKFRITLPNTSHDQAKIGTVIPLEEARTGDLIFFQGQDLTDQGIHHVGIVTEVTNEVVHFIHSSKHHGISYDNLNSSYYKPRFVKVVRLK